MDDIEAMFSIHGVSREQLRFIPDEHGGAVAGELIVYDTDLETGKTEKIDCTRFGSGAYSIPSLVEHLTFETKAKFVLCIETGGMFQRLQSHKFWKKAHCILVSMAGVPTRATRRFVRRLSDQCKMPVYAFVDCDPYGISNIYRTLKVGSGNAAHINQFFCVPQAHFLGVTPQDIIDYKLPTHPLKDVDIKRAKDALKNDPFFKQHKPWQKALNQLLKMGVRAEQQALARWGLNYVIEEYLPREAEGRRPSSCPELRGQASSQPPGTSSAGSMPSAFRQSRSRPPPGGESRTSSGSTGAMIHDPSPISRSSWPGPQPA